MPGADSDPLTNWEMLNLLTPPVVAAAAKEIISGVRVSLGRPLNKHSYPSYGRDPYIHEAKEKGGPDRVVNDDILTFNTQSSSQWDGSRHCGLLFTYNAKTASPSCDLAYLYYRVFKGATVLQQSHPRPAPLV